MEAGAYNLCHWTGRAVRVSDIDFDLSLLRDAAGAVIPAMPDDLLAEEQQLRQMMGPMTDAAMHCYDNSKVIQWEVFNVPPRPSRNKADFKYFNVLTAKVDSIKKGCFIPTGILKEDINTNEGLCKILRDHYESNNMHIRGQLECKEYTQLNTDMAIFWRILKVRGGREGRAQN